MSEKAAKHWEAAGRHESAADNHARAAAFWEAQGDSVRARLQHEMAEYERRGADLELRWAETVDPETGQRKLSATEQIIAHTRQGAKTAASMLMQLAETLERTAELADAHGQRRERTGHTDDASKERQAAQHARAVAQRARSQAEEWRRLFEARVS